MLLLCLWVAPLLLASVTHHSIAHVSLVTLGLLTTTGFGEEFFFWGYAQPRLNEALGRPYRWKGIQFGLGLVVTALLFGLVHAWNGVDFLHGSFHLNWGWGLAACLAGAAHGLLREATGSIVAGTVFHGINDAWLLVVIPMMFG